jgi:hypothetical protein
MDPMRDKTMAETSMAILNSDKNNKLVAWLGAHHATRGEGTFGQLMAENFASRGQNEKVASFVFSNERVPSSTKGARVVPLLTGNKPNRLGRLFMNNSDRGVMDQLIVP